MVGVPPSEPNRCAHPRRDGQPCRAPVLGGGQFCFGHDPARQQERDAARRKGGTNSAKVVRLRALVPPRLLPVFDRLERALEEVHAGRLTPQQATAMAAVARALVAVLTAGELEARVRTLEEQRR